MSTEKHSCTCHGLEQRDFVRACNAGAHNVKTCFHHLGCKPKCADCIPLVRSVLQQYASSAYITDVSD